MTQQTTMMSIEEPGLRVAGTRVPAASPGIPTPRTRRPWMRAARLRPWQLLATALVSALAIAAVSLATQMGPHSTRRAAATVGLTAGDFSVSNSKPGQAIFSAQNVGPGSAANGQTTIANSGAVAGSFELSKTDLIDQPGPGGARLSDLAQLTVRDITGSSPSTVYAGKLAAMPDLPLGSFAPGEARTYDFSVSLPRNATAVPPVGDLNAYQSSALQVAYAWTGTASEPTGDPPPPSDATPPPSDTAPPPGAPSPTPSKPAPPSGGGSTTTGGRPAPPTASGEPSDPERPSLRSPGRTVPPSRVRSGTGATTANDRPRGSRDAPELSGKPLGSRAGLHGGRGKGWLRSEGSTGGTGVLRGADESPGAKLLGLAGKAFEKGGFPFLLFLIMVGFFYVQNWLDRRDPKLALAPVDPEPRRSFH